MIAMEMHQPLCSVSYPLNSGISLLETIRTIADAILDRLMHDAHRLKLKGESMRKTRSSLTDGEHLG